MPHQFNNTNFHFHGAHASPSGIADNVMRSMAPGHSYDIEIALPADHTSGTYWYHPHHHGSADIQMSSGMVGALIIEGDFADVPEIAAATRAPAGADPGGLRRERHGREFRDAVSRRRRRASSPINGQRRPMIEMRPGEVQRWRILNAAYQDDMLLDLEKHDLHAIAYDGIQLGADAATLKQLLIAPGQRADVLVQAGAPGTYAFNAAPYDQGHPSPVGPLARLVVSGAPMDMKLPARLAAAAAREPSRTPRSPTAARWCLSATAPEADAAGHWQEFGFFVDGKKFDPDRIDQRGQARRGRGVDDRQHA